MGNRRAYQPLLGSVASKWIPGYAAIGYRGAYSTAIIISLGCEWRLGCTAVGM